MSDMMQKIRFCLQHCTLLEKNMKNIQVSKKFALKIKLGANITICVVAGLSICSPDGDCGKYVTGCDM